MAARIYLDPSGKLTLFTGFGDLNVDSRVGWQRSIFDPDDTTNAAVAEGHHQPQTAYVFTVLNLNPIWLRHAVAFHAHQVKSLAVHCFDIEIDNTSSEPAGDESTIRPHPRSLAHAGTGISAAPGLYHDPHLRRQCGGIALAAFEDDRARDRRASGRFDHQTGDVLIEHVEPQRRICPSIRFVRRIHIQIVLSGPDVR